jgi:hypothetical protein
VFYRSVLLILSCCRDRPILKTGVPFDSALIKNETVKDDRSDCGDSDEEREEMLKAEILAEKTPDPTIIAQ